MVLHVQLFMNLNTSHMSCCQGAQVSRYSDRIRNKGLALGQFNQISRKQLVNIVDLVKQVAYKSSKKTRSVHANSKSTEDLHTCKSAGLKG